MEEDNTSHHTDIPSKNRNLAHLRTRLLRQPLHNSDNRINCPNQLLNLQITRTPVDCSRRTGDTFSRNHTDAVSILMIKRVHYASSARTRDICAVCPEKEVCRVEQPQLSQYTQPRLPSLFAMGKVASMPVRFFLDSGADLTIVSDGLVHELAKNGTQIINPSEDVTIKGVHTTFTSLPTIHLSCELCDSKFDMKMAISNDISHDVILGRDCAYLYDLMTNANTDIPQEILAVQTRQQSTVEHQSQQANEEAEQTSDNQTRPFQQIGNDYDLPLQSQQTDMAEEDEPPLEADDNVISLMNEQRADPTLATL